MFLLFLQEEATKQAEGIKFDFNTIDWKVILAALALLVAIFVALYFQWWRNRKRLSYEILSNVLLLSAEKEIQDKVEIRYEGEPVKNVRVIVIRLINDGYVPIKKDEFEKAVRFIFPEAKILSAERVKFHPKNLGTQITYRDDWLELDPALFNRKDYVQFKVLLSGYREMEIDARIVGVSTIGKTKRLANASDIFIMLSGFLLSVLLPFFMADMFGPPFPASYKYLIMGFAIVIVLLFYNILRRRESDNIS